MRLLDAAANADEVAVKVASFMADAARLKKPDATFVKAGVSGMASAASAPRSVRSTIVTSARVGPASSAEHPTVVEFARDETATSPVGRSTPAGRAMADTSANDYSP